jgi:hypothetical protein
VVFFDRCEVPPRRRARVACGLVLDDAAAGQDLDRQAFLCQWQIEHSYDTAQECEKAAVSLPLYDVPKNDPPYGAQRINGICVSSDDPRLKPPFNFSVGAPR